MRLWLMVGHTLYATGGWHIIMDVGLTRMALSSSMRAEFCLVNRNGFLTPCTEAKPSQIPVLYIIRAFNLKLTAEFPSLSIPELAHNPQASSFGTTSIQIIAALLDFVYLRGLQASDGA